MREDKKHFDLMQRGAQCSTLLFEINSKQYMKREIVIKRALELAKNRIRMGEYAITEQEIMLTNGSWEAGFVEAVLLFHNEQNEHLLKEVHKMCLTEEQINTLIEGLNYAMIYNPDQAAKSLVLRKYLEKEIAENQNIVQKARESNKKQ